MARFMGSVKGGRGAATRLGHKSTGLTLEAKSHEGAVKVLLYAIGEKDHAEIWLDLSEGKGVKRLVYSGPIDSNFKRGS